MQVTSQVDAMKTLKVDPVGYYFTPRIIAAAVTVPMVVLLAEFVGIVGGMLVAQSTIDLHPARYMNSAWLWMSTKDIYISLLKASIFGILISLVCATQGYNTKVSQRSWGIYYSSCDIVNRLYASCGFFNKSGFLYFVNIPL